MDTIDAIYDDSRSLEQRILSVAPRLCRTCPILRDYVDEHLETVRHGDMSLDAVQRLVARRFGSCALANHQAVVSQGTDGADCRHPLYGVQLG